MKKIVTIIIIVVFFFQSLPVLNIGYKLLGYQPTEEFTDFFGNSIDLKNFETHSKYFISFNDAENLVSRIPLFCHLKTSLPYNFALEVCTPPPNTIV